MFVLFDVCIYCGFAVFGWFIVLCCLGICLCSSIGNLLTLCILFTVCCCWVLVSVVCLF